MSCSRSIKASRRSKQSPPLAVGETRSSPKSSGSSASSKRRSTLWDRAVSAHRKEGCRPRRVYMMAVRSPRLVEPDPEDRVALAAVFRTHQVSPRDSFECVEDQVREWLPVWIRDVG